MKQQSLWAEERHAILHIPFAGSVPAGFPSPASDYLQQPIDLYEHIIKHPSATFYMTVVGDSMIGANIPPQSIVVIDKALTAKHNDIVIAVVNGEFMIKRLEKRVGNIRLLSANPNYRPIHFEEGMECFIWGVVTFVLVDTKTV